MKIRKLSICLFLILFVIYFITGCADQDNQILDPRNYKHYITRFNENHTEVYQQYVPNYSAWDFLKENIPLIDCPDKDIERTYYYRWWTFRKHIKKTPFHHVITEFLPGVGWSGKYNTISCSAGHHIYEGRWLRNSIFINDYIDFWLRESGEGIRSYSFWIADAVLAFNKVHRNDSAMTAQLSYLVDNYIEWEKIRRDSGNILFWQVDDRDGMEFTASGRILNEGVKKGWLAATRPTINSYMYGDARAISCIAGISGEKEIMETYNKKASRLKEMVQKRLWNDRLKFFTVLPRSYTETSKPLDIRELIGYVPWYFNLPDDNNVYPDAWQQLRDTMGFKAFYGPTTCERRHPYFEVTYQGHACQWNGPSWPFATSQTLTAMANLLNNYSQDVVSKEDFLKLLQRYAYCHQRITKDGKKIAWIDENLNPFTGEWLARSILDQNENYLYEERGKAYNHSSFCDLVISGLMGIRPTLVDSIRINPLVPENQWDWFCLDRIPYHGGELTILWDKTGDRYNKGKGYKVYFNGKIVHASKKIEEFNHKLEY
ncbi:MAG: MGH1-like glycoside hydrolase domain-containing protein [Bacteroidota bacterium]